MSTFANGVPLPFSRYKVAPATTTPTLAYGTSVEDLIEDFLSHIAPSRKGTEKCFKLGLHGKECGAALKSSLKNALEDFV